MIKTYPEDTIVKKLRMLEVLLWVGILIVSGLVLSSYLLGDKRLFAAGVGVLAITVAVLLWRGTLADKFSRSAGGVLEVLDGVVLVYHTLPFVYCREEAGETQLVPFPVGAVAATRTLRLAVYGNVLSCAICCSATPGRCQVVYDAFLRPDLPTKIITTPEIAVAESVTTFLLENRTNLVLLYQSDEVSADLRDVYVAGAVKRKAEEYLRYELYIYGLVLGQVSVTCRLLPLIID